MMFKSRLQSRFVSDGTNVSSSEQATFTAVSGTACAIPQYNHYNARVFKDKCTAEQRDQAFEKFNQVMHHYKGTFCLTWVLPKIAVLMSIAGFIIFAAVPASSSNTDGFITGVVLGTLLFMGGPLFVGAVWSCCIRQCFTEMAIEMRQSCANLEGQFGLVWTVNDTTYQATPPTILVQSKAHADQMSNMHMGMNVAMGNLAMINQNRMMHMAGMGPIRANIVTSANMSAIPVANATAIPITGIPTATASTVASAPDQLDAMESADLKMSGTIPLPNDVTEKLKQLAGLYESGALSEEEYRTAKLRVLRM